MTSWIYHQAEMLKDGLNFAQQTWRPGYEKWLFGAALLAFSNHAFPNPEGWRPEAGHEQLLLWPDVVPDPRPMPGYETQVSRSDPMVAGSPWLAVTNVSRPTLTVYAPKGPSNGATVVVFPGGGFQVLAMDLEGTEICDWLTGKGITCVLLKYRVPSIPYGWKCSCYPDLYAESTSALQDAQSAIGLVRLHAKDWHIDPAKVGVLGFSAGGYLVAETSTRLKSACTHPLMPLTGKAQDRILRLLSIRVASQAMTTS